MRKLAVVVALILAVILFATWRGKTAQTAGPSAASKSAEPALPPPSQRVRPSTGSSGAAEATRFFDGIATLSQLQRALDAGTFSPAQRLEIMRLAVSSCERPTEPNPILEARKQASPKFRRSQDHLAEHFESFCDAEMDPSWELIEAVMDQDPADPVVMAHSLSTLEGEQRATVGVPTAERLLETPDAIEAHFPAAVFLGVEERDLPAVARNPFPRSIDTPQERLDAQLLALQMVACQVRGGCGPGGVLTMRNCGLECAPGVSLAQAWSARYPPIMIDYARQLAADMLGRNEPLR